MAVTGRMISLAAIRQDTYPFRFVLPWGLDDRNGEGLMAVDGSGWQSAFDDGRTGCTPRGFLDTARVKRGWCVYRAWKISRKAYRTIAVARGRRYRGVLDPKFFSLRFVKAKRRDS